MIGTFREQTGDIETLLVTDHKVQRAGSFLGGHGQSLQLGQIIGCTEA